MSLSRRHFIGALTATGGVLAMSRAAGAITPAISPRTVAHLVDHKRTMVGSVFDVRRTLPSPQVDRISPFILLDNFDMALPANSTGGLAAHPHRGFETVTVLMDGEVEHGDSIGNRGVIASGDVQWMTAARGIVHEENPSDAFRKRGGRMYGVQLWVNLPARHKMDPPKYQDTSSVYIPVVDDGGVRARVIAGAAHGVSAVIGTHTPMALIDYVLSPGAQVTVPLPAGWTAFVHVLHGTVDSGSKRAGTAQLLHYSPAGDGVHLANVSGTKNARVLLGAGEPIDEPLVRYGPFAMNTKAEIQAAIADYRSGKMGRVPPR